MTKVKFPKTPAQVYRETTAGIVAYNAGLALRVTWEVSKPIIKWTGIIAVLSFAWTIHLLWQLVLGTMKR